MLPRGESVSLLIVLRKEIGRRYCCSYLNDSGLLDWMLLYSDSIYFVDDFTIFFLVLYRIHTKRFNILLLLKVKKGCVA